jgi:putative intracellular protease/amidase/pimeloyl-ACP methyl ester carboxylesterase
MKKPKVSGIFLCLLLAAALAAPAGAWPAAMLAAPGAASDPGGLRAGAGGGGPLNVLVLLGEWFGDAYFPLADEIAARGWTMKRVGVEAEYRGCYNKKRDVVLRSDVLIRDLRDFSAYDALIIPSGPQFRKFMENEAVLKFLRDAHESGLLIASFCVGNYLVKAAGLTDLPTGELHFSGEVKKVGPGILLGPWGGGPPPGDGFESAPIKEICDAVEAQAAAGEKLSSRAEPAEGRRAIHDLESGPYPVGFELIETNDPSRTFPSLDGRGFRERPMRVYVWYPAREKGAEPLTVGDFVDMAADDFRLSGSASSSGRNTRPLPVPLAEGLDEAGLRDLLARPLDSFRGLEPSPGEFPLLVVGQGLYYESPLDQVYLCEFLAGRGYVVAACPLLGTQYRLENLSVEDLETEIRDMEFVIGTARARPAPKVRGLAVVGYDIGGMAGLVLTMRNPEVEAFLSLDCAILFPHSSGLPLNHPGYREDRFTVPWMHATQARFIEAGRAREGRTFLSDRKTFGDTWLVSVPTVSHGQFSSYAKFGILKPVPGYWGEAADDAEFIHDALCGLAGDFLDAVLKKDAGASKRLEAAAGGGESNPFKVEFKKGRVPPPSSRSLIHSIIESGPAAVRPEIERLRSADPAAKVVEETELDWLAYHFLLWWGRKDEALEAFRLNVELNPNSANAHAGLGEALLTLGRNGEAAAEFRKALEINPDMPGVKAALEKLEKK